MENEAGSLVIYADKSSPRLQYILDFIFKEQFLVSYRLVTDLSFINSKDGPLINYSNKEIPAAINILPAKLLFEDFTSIQKVAIKKQEKTPYLFFDDAENFDLLAACFYLLTRYEEYNHAGLDEFGRYPHTASIAYREGFLHLPMVDVWLKRFEETIRSKFPKLRIQRQPFQYLPTYDIDHAYFLKGKPFFQQAGSLLQKDRRLRWQIWTGKTNDPYDAYDALDQWHEELQSDPAYFFLVAAKRGQYDKNISPDSDALQQLTRQTASKYRIGLHPSWQSSAKPILLKDEKNRLENIAKKSIAISRHHYLKFLLPGTYRNLLANGITTDYSMGYGGANGFRASTGLSFYWFDLEKNSATPLRIIPFCFMDANSFYEQKQDAAQTLKELTQLLYTCKKYHTPCCTIFHNNFLGSHPQFTGWNKMYGEFLKLTKLPVSDAVFSHCS